MNIQKKLAELSETIESNKKQLATLEGQEIQLIHNLKELIDVETVEEAETVLKKLDRKQGKLDEEIEDTFSEWIDLKWKKQIIEVNFNDFNEKTQIFMKDRKMGMLDLTDIPNDKERNNLHRDLATNDGKNEPVIITKTSEGYELLEGWHRTMSILSLGSDGTDNYEYWDKVKLNAWVGY